MHLDSETYDISRKWPHNLIRQTRKLKKQGRLGEMQAFRNTLLLQSMPTQTKSPSVKMTTYRGKMTIDSSNRSVHEIKEIRLHQENKSNGCTDNIKPKTKPIRKNVSLLHNLNAIT